ncbi:MAG: TIGR03936 family radical SAM-associated protein [Clostridiales bacterium]|nr:TIGR03936 family radical SAM-associated protein [Clostridiales bacterium]
MLRIRCRFSKKDDMIFTSHLDLVKFFGRAMRRANIPIAYSQGFNPHPIMSFATALGIGVASNAEYLDIQLDKEIEADAFTKSLNDTLPKGLSIWACKYIDKSEKSLMSIVNRSVYAIEMKLKNKTTQKSIEKEVEKFLEQDSIIYIKERKKKNKWKRNKKSIEMNIRELIYGIEVMSLIEGKIIMKMSLAAGSENNLKPEVVISKLNEMSEVSAIEDSIRVTRLDLLKRQGEQYVPLMSI